MTDPMERTLVLLKPDALHRRLLGRILARFEDKGLRIVALKMLRLSRQVAAAMYAEHEGKDFHAPLIEFVTAGPVVATVLEGKDAVPVVRAMLGATFGPDAAGGTVRGDFGMSRRYNLVHGSDSPEAAAREIALLFDAGELMDYQTDDTWVYARSGGRRI